MRKLVVMTMTWTTGPIEPPAGCWHGSLESITDTERRALRPIGATAHEVAVRTGVLLAELLALPGIQIFQGVCHAAADLPRIPHAIQAWRQVILVESVAWPPGHYAATPEGRIFCDGVYIGQSMRPLKHAVRHWQEILPPGHRVSGLVVVHPTDEGDLRLAETAAKTVSWACACDAVREVRANLPRRRQPASIRAVAVLIAATAEEENR
jgi:hypothetical protein